MVSKIEKLTFVKPVFLFVEANEDVKVANNNRQHQ